MTGFRDENFKMNLRDIGVKIASSVSSNVDILVVKSMDIGCIIRNGVVGMMNG